MSGFASSKTKAADLLLQARAISQQQHERVLALVHASQERSEEMLLDADVFTEANLLKALSSVYRTHFVSSEKLAKADIPRATVQMIPKRVAETLGVFPVLFDRQNGVLSIVTPDPENVELLREVKLVSGASDVKAFVSRPAAVAAAIRKHHGGDARAFELLERNNIHYDFGQTMLADGQVKARKESTRRHDDMGSAPMQPTAKRVSVVDDDELVIEHRPGRTTQATTGRTTRREETMTGPQMISVPPPPMPGQQYAREASVVAPLPAPPMPLPPPPTPPAPVPAPPVTHNSEISRLSVLQNDTTIELLTVMVSLLENQRQELCGHSSQVARLLRRVAERMNLERADTYAVIVAGHIHDLGKMGQFHLTALNCSEYEGHRTAAQKAHDTPLRLLEAVRLTTPTKNAVFHMYERFDGKGFPDKLMGKEIPLGARLLSVADTYADLTQNPRNPFRKVLSPSEAMTVLLQHKGTIFDPAILDLFKALVLDEDMKAKLLANRYRALIVDADPEASTVLELRMVEQGFDVKTARTVDAARKLLSSDRAEHDVVVCEVEMPDTDGLAFLSEARKTSWGRDMPWVVHSHKQSRTDAQRAFDLGALDFVSKSQPADVLVAKLKALLDQRASSGSGGKTTKGVSGSLREMGLPDIVQVLFHGRKTGKLAVRSNGKTGEIHFLEGAIANALIDDKKGTEAFYAMLKFQDGDFALDPSFAPPARLIQEPAEALLLEGMRRMDEEGM